MSENKNTSMMERIWNQLEERYGTENVSCSCMESEVDVEALQQSNLTAQDLESYQNGTKTIDELVAALDMNINVDQVDDLESLSKAIRQAETTE